MKYRAVIFDLDGLMIDSERMCFNLWKKKADEIGVEMNEDMYRFVIGANTNKVQELLSMYPFLKDVVEYAKIQRTPYFKEVFKKPGSCLKPGLKPLYRYLKDHGYRIAIASSSNHEYIEMVLEHFGFHFEADVIVGGDEVSIPKPEPDVFLYAQEHLGIPKEECIILEDSKNGILAANAAQIDVVFIPDMVPLDEQMASIIKTKRSNLLEIIDVLKENV